MDVQTDIGHVVKMLASNKPDDLADHTFGTIGGHATKGVQVNLFILCQVRHIVQCCALRRLQLISASRTVPVYERPKSGYSLFV